MSAKPFDDVRMRGFRSRKPVQDVITWIDLQVKRIAVHSKTELVELQSAVGRVTSNEIVSKFDVPSYARAMMDGFALHADDTLGATNYNPLELKIIGRVLPGQSFDKPIPRGHCVSIMTGAPVPQGADAVLPAEKVSRDGDQLTVLDEVPPAKHVGKIGEDIPCGAVAMPVGRRLRPQDLGVLSSIGMAHVSVIKSPRVRLIITGNELCTAGSQPAANQTVDANSPMLSALIQRDGGELLFEGITPDTPEQIEAAMLDETVDIVIVSGGSSVGEEDHAPRILSQAGELAIHGVAMRPSSPTGMGCIGDRLVFLLPGNPVSCLCAYDFFAGRAIRLLSGRSSNWPYSNHTGKLTRKLSSVVGRQDYARVLVTDEGVEPIAIAGASVLSSTSRADGFVIIPSDSEGYPPGADIEYFRYDAL